MLFLVEISITIKEKHLRIQLLYLFKKGYACYTRKHMHHYTLLPGWLYLRDWVIFQLYEFNWCFPEWVFTQLRNLWSSIWWLMLRTSKWEKPKWKTPNILRKYVRRIDNVTQKILHSAHRENPIIKERARVYLHLWILGATE